MRRLFLIILLAFISPDLNQMLSSGAGFVQAQDTPPSNPSSEETPQYAVPQNVPCRDQPRSLRELSVAFQNGRLPLDSETTGTWVEIGDVNKNPYTHSERAMLNCAGLKRGSKFEFVLVANNYTVQLHAIGMTYPQKITMNTSHDENVEFSVDFAADEGPDTYRCRLTKRGTLACLIKNYRGAEFKKVAVETRQIYEP
jgi:hypothetical protein